MKKPTARKVSEPKDIDSLAIHVDVADAIKAMNDFAAACKAASAAHDELRRKMSKDVTVNVGGPINPRNFIG
jgi:hypothetical protein